MIQKSGALVAVGLSLATAFQAHAQSSTSNCQVWGNTVNCTHRQRQVIIQENPLANMAAAALQSMAAQRAAEAQAAWQVAGRIAEQAAVTARERAAQTSAVIPELLQLAMSTPLSTPAVNTELVTDWALLDGLTLSTEQSLDNGWGRRMNVRFALNPTPNGNNFVQLRVDSYVTAPDGFSRRTVAQEVIDGRYDLATGATLITASREPRSIDAPAMYESIVLIGEHGFQAKMNGVAVGKVAFGAVPSPVLPYVVAAMPGALPDSLAIWVLDWETGNVVQARFTSQSRGKLRVPVARNGASCEEKTPTVNRDLDVRVYRLRIGTQEMVQSFLENAPHLPVSRETRCVDMVR